MVLCPLQRLSYFSSLGMILIEKIQFFTQMVAELLDLGLNHPRNIMAMHSRATSNAYQPNGPFLKRPPLSTG